MTRRLWASLVPPRTGFGWLDAELRDVQTRKFFLVDGAASDSLRQLIESSPLPVPDSYKTFALRFGNAKLYRQHAGYALGVLAAPAEAVSEDGQLLLCIGHYLDRGAYFKRALLASGRESPVFEGGEPGLQEVASGFAEWLRTRSDLIRKSIGPRRWKEIVRGPQPFSDGERAIVEARRAYQWRVVRIPDDGKLEFEVFNGSALMLPFLSIGARSRRGNFEGRVWLPVQHLNPGATVIVTHPCYKDQVGRDEIEVFNLPDPLPEDRESYWEFRAHKVR